MGLLRFLKKNSGSNNAEEQVPPTVSDNTYLIENLRQRLTDLGYRVTRHPDYLALILNEELEIATAIVSIPEHHPNILQLMVQCTHPLYFPMGIIDNCVGLGASFEEKTNSVLDNYLNFTFPPIVDSLSDHHSPEYDLPVVIQGKEILWHPNLGSLGVQGPWTEAPREGFLFELLKEGLQRKLGDQKLNWLKLYISKRADGTLLGECLFNNTPWEEGLSLLHAYAGSWQLQGDFQGLKQFIMLRRCDACDA